jgi:2-polyprenyl-6-methoxyphenol hydroxylase-like FAD-dependent oxidoreductase
LHLLQLLQKRARDAGVELAFGQAIDFPELLDGDLVIGADGFNSMLRNGNPRGFGQSLAKFSNRFAWFGTEQRFETLTQTFVKTDLGAFNAHHYRYEEYNSTFIVECDEACFRAYGFDRLSPSQSRDICEEIFAEALQGQKLIENHSIWRQFPKLWCENWVVGNRVLLGDAAHTAHFSIGSGTRLAMEDAIALAKAIREHEDLSLALKCYQEIRKPIARKIVEAANASALWYDGFSARMDTSPMDFAFDYITRSGRIDLEKLRKYSPEFMANHERYRLRTTS